MFCVVAWTLGRSSADCSPFGAVSGMDAMATLDVDAGQSESLGEHSSQLDPIRDFTWHRQHRCRRSGQVIDIVMLASWAALVCWVLLH
jgi:hypothetical protein